MCPIASTKGTIPGFFVTSTCSIVFLKYFDLSAFSFAFSGVVFSSAMVATPSKGRETGSENEKSHLGQLRNVVLGVDNRHCGPGWLLQNAFYDEWYGRVKKM